MIGGRRSSRNMKLHSKSFFTSLLIPDSLDQLHYCMHSTQASSDLLIDTKTKQNCAKSGGKKSGDTDSGLKKNGIVMKKTCYFPYKCF